MAMVQRALDLARLADRFRGISAAAPLANGVNGESCAKKPSPLANGVNGESPGSKPLANGVNGDGRDSRGRFTVGNKGGPGNPFTRRVARLRQLVLETVRDEGLQAIVQRLVDAAKCGNIPAARLVLAYVVGKPVDAVDPDRVDVDGWKLLLEMGIVPQEFLKLLHHMPANLACELTEIAWPCIASLAGQAAVEKSEIGTPAPTPDPTPAPARSPMPSRPASAKRGKKKPRKAA